MKTKTSLMIALMLMVGLAACTPAQESADDMTDEAATSQVVESDTAAADETMADGEEEMMADGEMASYTLAQIAEHTTAEDCWMAVDGKVYDVTAFIAAGKHGGGDAILEGCGIDASAYYNDRSQWSGEESPDSHSDMARGLLDGFEIGTLATE